MPIYRNDSVNAHIWKHIDGIASLNAHLRKCIYRSTSINPHLQKLHIYGTLSYMYIYKNTFVNVHYESASVNVQLQKQIYGSTSICAHIQKCFCKCAFIEAIL